MRKLSLENISPSTLKSSLLLINMRVDSGFALGIAKMLCCSAVFPFPAQISRSSEVWAHTGSPAFGCQDKIQPTLNA